MLNWFSKLAGGFEGSTAHFGPEGGLAENTCLPTDTAKASKLHSQSAQKYAENSGIMWQAPPQKASDSSRFAYIGCMAEPLVLHGLRNKRAELAGEVIRVEKEVARLRAVS